KIRDLCDEHGSLMVLDEVITGFRVGGLGCAQSKFGVEPDITTFAKIIGGGFPVGAVGGRTEIMESLTPSGDVFQAGTFSGHPVAMVAGLETLRFAERNDVYDHVNSLGDELRRGINGIIEDEGLPYTVVGTDSMFKTVFTRDGSPEVADDCATGCAQNEGCPNYGACPKNGGDVDDAMTERWQRVFWHEMLDEGVFLTPNQFESQFVSYAHTEEDVEETLEAYKEAL
ncbi:MAG: aminotransferase class III-fold pyridoxal phosphate-dependent enzyme, partial [Halobacteria archaeon]|nr:aminotransferase class III-fold pyridoxal phosphate-dependent enzyme [Halobacteria archaeon]